MAYFSYVPDIEWDNKPISYPFSSSDFITTKNFFRRYQINEKVFDSAVYYTEYAVEDGERPDTVANKFYGNSFLDWVVLLTNNVINPLFEWPMSEHELRKYAERTYEDPYNGIHHYETISKEDQLSVYGQIIIEPGITVDEYFYTSKGDWLWENPPVPIPDSNLPVVVGSVVPAVQTLVDFSNLGVYETDMARFLEENIGIGAVIDSDGTGAGSFSGFNIGTYLLFGSIQAPRFALLKSVDLTNIETLTLKAIRGNGSNGGETPDIENSEELEICFFDGYEGVLGSRGGWSSGNSTAYQQWVTSIPQSDFSVAIPVNSGSPEEYTLDNEIRSWTINVPLNKRKNDVFILFRQKSASGAQYDYYGLKTLEYQGTTIVYNDPDTNDTTVEIGGNLFTYRYNEDSNSWYAIKAVIGNETYLWSFDFSSNEYRWGRNKYKGYIYYDQKDNTVKTVPGNDVSFPVKQFNYESQRNEEKRNIFILKPEYISLFVDEFRRRNLYKSSGDFITERLKKTGV